MRRKQLHRVLGLSRLLIRPAVQCRSLASKVLSMALHQLPDDFRRRYGSRPALLGYVCRRSAACRELLPGRQLDLRRGNCWPWALCTRRLAP